MRRVLIVLLILSGVLAETAAMAQEPARLALLIGNSRYTQKVGQLKNPRNDVAIIGVTLKKLGFNVTIVEDADYRAMDTAIKRHVAQVRNAGDGAISFFYYSGHGAANPDSQINYLIPVDVADPSDVNLWYESFQQNDVIDKLSKQAPNATHYVVFDACRNELNLSGPAAKALGAEKGFVPVPQTAGILIAYATAPNKTASDVGEGGGPYAKALAEELLKPGVEAVTMFRNVQIRVKKSIGQDPWLSFPALPPVYLAGSQVVAVAPKEQPVSLPPRAAALSSVADQPIVASPRPTPLIFSVNRIYRVLDNVSQGILNMRAGPGINNPIVVAIPAGASDLSVGYCNHPDERGGSPWCEVKWHGYTGWVSSCCMVEVSAPAERTFRVLPNVSQGVLNMRKGPGTTYDLVTSIPGGALDVTVRGCRLSDDASRTAWCEVHWRGKSGWASACCMVDITTGAYARAGE